MSTPDIAKNRSESRRDWGGGIAKLPDDGGAAEERSGEEARRDSGRPAARVGKGWAFCVSGRDPKARNAQNVGEAHLSIKLGRVLSFENTIAIFS